MVALGLLLVAFSPILVIAFAPVNTIANRCSFDFAFPSGFDYKAVNSHSRNSNRSTSATVDHIIILRIQGN
jgi:hypothetical protein